MSFDLARYTSVLRSSAIFLPEPRERTLFSVGGRGYFESPATDLLGVFLNPGGAHGLGSLFLRSLLDSVGAAGAFEPALVAPPLREVVTANSNRIDLVLVGASWVMAIENKIRHAQVNPFEDYDRYLEERFKGKEVLKIILSLAGVSEQDTWISLAYRDLISSARKHLDQHSAHAEPAKWLVFLEEFLFHLQNETTELHITDEQIAFVESNYDMLNRLTALQEEYSRTIERQAVIVFQGLFPEYSITR